MNNRSVIVIFAPTACGKTALARELFGKSSLSCFKGLGEVVSADSQAVYKGMNIGTAKPDEKELLDIPHHLIDVVAPDVQFGVGDFLERADDCCEQILKRNHYPIVAGGTGFYIRNFLMGLPVTPISNGEIRDALKLRIEKEGNLALYAELKEKDPCSAKKINVHDAYRIVRALEVLYASGKPLSSYALPSTLRSTFRFLPIILVRDRDDLYNRINERVDRMFLLGLAEEVARLKDAGLTKDSPGMKAIGYSEFFMPELTSIDQIKERIKKNSRRYAKRQYTFMRDIPGAVTFHAEDKDGILAYLQRSV
ncbi:MAG: tRNA (adenosine(37)-N6)-dimethylallyltransferase MiaA [Treponema sp.]|nr:tRNA (adenosine(37)-N6)-dimethylallyltransferase MiaA [Treponema sp.]